MSPANAETLPPGGADALLKRRCRELLADARQRTLELVAEVSDRDMNRVHDPLMSPLAWDLGHIAAFEDLWTCRVHGLDLLRPELAHTYDAAETPRPVRASASYLRAAEAREYMEAVRTRALAALERSDLSSQGEPLGRAGLVWELILEHEHQHNETMLQTLRLAEPGVYRPARRPREGPGRSAVSGTVRVDAGPFPMGADAAGFAYDNERPRHDVELSAFEIDVAPVTNAAYAEFVESGGYGRRACWSEEGWEWRRRAGAERPLYWTADGGERIFDRTEPLEPDLPVMHVSWYEADAYARWRGGRLPTEQEWEKAASWDPASGEKRPFPWGHEPPGDWSAEGPANLDQRAFGAEPVGARPAGASPWGVLGMVGDAWEWTASDFLPYPGFHAFPYREYSEPFFGATHKVLRGGSWATRPRAIRNTFRNWDLPDRRQIHAGFRCAADA